MKKLSIAFATLLTLTLAAAAAPRLLVSTPSLSPESTIQFVFDLPVAAPTQLGQPIANDLVAITPALPGKIVWKSQTVAELLPDQAPAIGASYRFEITPGHKHLDGSAIPAGEFATAASETFEARSASCRERWSGTYQPATADWQLRFNDAVDPATAARHVAFFAASGERVQAKLRTATQADLASYERYFPTWSERAERAERASAGPRQPAAEAAPESLVPTVLIATPAEVLPPLGKWELIVVQGCPNKSGSAATVLDSRHEIGEIKPFAVSSAGPRVSTRTPREIRIGFTQSLPELLPADFLAKCVVLTPRPANLTAETDRSQLTLKGDFSVTDKYSLTIKGPLPSAVGHPLVKKFTQDIIFEHLPASLVLPTRDQGQLANGTRTYQVGTVNLAKAQLRIKRLNGTDSVRAFQALRQPPPAPAKPDGPFLKTIVPFQLVNGNIILEQDLPITNAIDTDKVIKIDWNRVMPNSPRTVTLFFDIVGTPRPELHQNATLTSQSIIQLTDIGLAWKLSRGEAFIYAFSCTTGKPLPDVKIEFFGADAKLLATVATDESGRVSAPRPKDAEVLRASLGEDEFLSPFASDDSLATVDLWRFPVHQTWQDVPEAARQVLMFTDRSLYRPGETVRLKGIVRSLRGNTLEFDSATAARMVVIDPTDTEIASKPLTISKNGSFDFTHTLGASQVGSHQFRLEYPEELARAEKLEDYSEREEIRQYASFEITVNVEDFRRNTFEVTQTIQPPPVAATEVKADVDAQYYQGQPVANGKLAYQVRIAEENLYPERFRDFLFGNHRSDDWRYWYHYFGCRWDLDGGDSDYGGSSREESSSQEEIVLSADGKALITVPLPKSEFPTGRNVSIMSETTDSNNQTLTAAASTTVHPASVYVGVSRIDQLVRAGDAVALKFVAVGLDGAPLAADVKVTATLTRQVSTTTKAQSDDGGTTTQNDTREETVITSETLIPAAASAGEGQPFSITPRATGRHCLTLRGTDADGREFATAISFHVYGTKEYPWLYEDGLRVKLIAEKQSYKPGETARLLVLSPIEGTALVTVERERVLRSFMVELKADQPVIEVPLGEEDAPYACVSVLIVKGLEDSTRKFKEPQLRLGYCGLNIVSQRQCLKLDLAASGPDSTLTKDIATFRPGAKVTFAGTVAQPDGQPAANAEVTLYAEDEGTLAVMGYRTPDPMAFFYTRRLLQVRTGLSFDTFLAEDPDLQLMFAKGFEVGGGGSLGNLADLLRKNFDPCATWAPALTTDAQGRFTHTCTLPDTLTRYRVIAVAHHQATCFGHIESAIIANKPLMLEPKAPRFANQGDRVEPRLLVQNASDFTGTWRITYQPHAAAGTPVCRALADASQSVTLAPGASANLVFPSILETTGEAVSTWQAEPTSVSDTELTPALARSLSDSVQVRYPVHYPAPLLRQSQYIKLDEAGAGLDLLKDLDPALLGGIGTLDLTFSTSQLVEAAGSIDYLMHYPHGCVEQTTSAMMSWFAVEPLRAIIPSFAKIPEERVTKAIQGGVDQLLSMQLTDGSFGYWPGASSSCDWASSYVGLGLILAKENGANVPAAAIAKLSDYLIVRLRNMKSAKHVWEFDIYARDLWVLSLAGKPQAAYQNTLADRLQDLSPGGRAFLAMAIASSDRKKDIAAARAILNSAKPIRVSEDWWMPYDTDTAVKFLAWTTLDPKGGETVAMLDRLLNERNPYGHWNNTWANGWSLMAITRYATANRIATQATNLTLDTPDGPRTIPLTPDAPSAASSFALGAQLRLALDNDGPAFIRLRLAAKPLLVPLQPVASNGLSIDRFYEKLAADGSATTLTEPAVGDLIKVTLRITLPTDETRYLVIDDPLPAVFEAVNNKFASQRSIVAPNTGLGDWQVSHTELRDERAVFYIDYVSNRGTYQVSYLARCTLAGQAIAPQAKVESIYDPTRFALSASRPFTAK